MRNCSLRATSPFPQCFHHIDKLGWLSANSFNLGQSKCFCLTVVKSLYFMLPVRYREISVKLFFDRTLLTLVKIPISMFLLCRLIAHASQPDGNMTSFTLHFSLLT